MTTFAETAEFSINIISIPPDRCAMCSVKSSSRFVLSRFYSLTTMLLAVLYIASHIFSPVFNNIFFTSQGVYKTYEFIKARHSLGV